MEISGFFKTSKELGSDDKRPKQCDGPVRLSKRPKLMTGRPQVEYRRMVGAVFDAIAAEDAILVGIDGKRRFENRTAFGGSMPCVTGVINAVAVTDVLVCTQFQ